MRIKFAGCSETGAVRNQNEDAILMRSSGNCGLFLVADGIGGRAHGEIASGLLREGYGRWWKERFLTARPPFPEALQEVKSVLFEINHDIVSRYGEMQIGSTLVLLLLMGENCACLSLGDSRIYRGRGLSVRQVTADDIGRNLQEDLATGEREKLVSAVGIRARPEFSIRTDATRPGDRFLLCSDGVYRYVAPKRLERKILLSTKPESAVANLAAEVESGGAGDNYSMIFVRTSPW